MSCCYVLQVIKRSLFPSSTDVELDADKCPICTERLADKALPGGHLYCIKCLLDWTYTQLQNTVQLAHQIPDSKAMIVKCPYCMAGHTAAAVMSLA